MYELSIKNINYLTAEVSKSGITYSHLLDDLIDHVCCDVENEMINGLPFEKAYEKVKQKIGIDGLQHIQNDTLYLIDKNYRTMKKTMRIFGVLSPILLAFGALFKIEHWPTAGIILVLGFFFLSFFFLPSAIYVSYKEISNRTRKWTHIIGFLGTFFLSISFLFKVMHWPGAAIVLLLGIVLTCFVFLPALLIHKIKETSSSVPKYVYVLAFTGFIFQLLGFTFKIMHWPMAGILLFSGIILFVCLALPIYTFKKYKESKSIENSFIYIIVALAWFIIPTTLLSVNISRNILNSNIENENIFSTDIHFLNDRNESLLKSISNNSKEIKIRNDAVALVADIQLMKADMIRLAERDHAQMVVNHNGDIDLNQLTELSNLGLCYEILKNGKAEKFSKMYNSLKSEMISLCNNQNCIEIINRILLDNPLDEMLNKQALTVFSLNNLSFLQLNILKAENIVLAEIASKQASAVTDQKHQK